MDVLINIIGAVVIIAVFGFVGFKLLKSKKPDLAEDIEEEVEEKLDKIRKNL